MCGIVGVNKWGVGGMLPWGKLEFIAYIRWYFGPF